MDLLGLFENLQLFQSHHNRCKRQLFWNLHRSKTSQQVKKQLLPRTQTCPLKNSGWKPTFLLKMAPFYQTFVDFGGVPLLSTWNFTLIGNLQYCSSEKECNALAPLLRLRQPRRGFQYPPLYYSNFHEKKMKRKNTETLFCVKTKESKKKLNEKRLRVRQKKVGNIHEEAMNSYLSNFPSLKMKLAYQRLLNKPNRSCRCCWIVHSFRWRRCVPPFS